MFNRTREIKKMNGCCRITPEWNDYPAKEAGVVSIAVRGPKETKPAIEAIIACLSDCDQKA
jgi:hypothetical protein